MVASLLISPPGEEAASPLVIDATSLAELVLNNDRLIAQLQREGSSLADAKRLLAETAVALAFRVREHTSHLMDGVEFTFQESGS